MNITAAQVSNTVTTNPPGLKISIDDIIYTAPQTFNWEEGSLHTLSVTSPQGALGSQNVFNSWSDNGDMTHNITAPSSTTTYTASFNTQYTLTTSANPSGGGTVSPSGANWYNSSLVVSISATGQLRLPLRWLVWRSFGFNESCLDHDDWSKECGGQF